MEKKNKGILINIIVLLSGMILMYGLFYFFPTQLSTTVQKLEKEVTVTDKGIADGVENIIDAVVVVETFKGDKGIGSGTGFVYKKTEEYAYIITNHHVVDGGNRIYARFTDDRRIETTVMASDELADIAVLRVKADEIISVAKMGSSVDMRVGDTVFATGAPIDSAYSWTVTRGIVSGKDRMVAVSLSENKQADWIMKVLQTDAAINSGNSGGPLANVNGEVIGVNSMKLASEGVEGMGFSIPIEDALDIAKTLEKGQVIQRPVLGISTYDLEYYNSAEGPTLEVPKEVKDGIVVDSVVAGSVAAKANFEKFDIIVKIDGQEVTSSLIFKYHLYKKTVGEKVNIVLYRDGKKITQDVTL